MLAYPRLQMRWRMSERKIEAFLSRVGSVSEIVHTTTPDRVVPADPDDDPIVQTAVLARADVLCTRDSHLLDAVVVEYCARWAIKVMSDIELYPLIGGHPPGR